MTEEAYYFNQQKSFKVGSDDDLCRGCNLLISVKNVR